MKMEIQHINLHGAIKAMAVVFYQTLSDIKCVQFFVGQLHLNLKTKFIHEVERKKTN